LVHSWVHSYCLQLSASSFLSSTGLLSRSVEAPASVVFSPRFHQEEQPA